ncbi:CPBP family intramembrane glutamic endopeptidase [Sporosarcina soli]|uniref:CPBP family intramembrane glutamic endopeptidase n=1 Tax=Sporosarcina soli TaxID=334736 RepID=A0ABW0TME1_9BACL
MGKDLTKKSSIGFSLFAVLLWWGILYSFSFIIKLMLQDGQSSTMYMMYFYLSVLVFFLIWYLACIPKILKVTGGQYSSYLKFLGLKGSRKGYIYTLFFLVLSITQYVLLPSNLQSPVSELIWSIQPPIVEEIIFRGFVLGVLLKSFSKPFSITISLLLFISIHFLNGPMGMLSATIFGLILIGIRLHTNSILPGIVIHYFVNEQILVLALPIALYCLFIIIKSIRRQMIQKQNKKAHPSC